MTTKWFIGDTHWGHAGILRYQPNRRYSSIEAMDNDYIERWNASVKPGDLVYHLGDLAFVNRVEDLKEYIDQLNGQIIWVTGNHDHLARKVPAKALMNTIPKLAKIVSYEEITVTDDEIEEGHKQRIIMCHYPLLSWNRKAYGAWHLFGHVHGTLGVGHHLAAVDVGIDRRNETFAQDKFILSYQDIKTIITRRYLEHTEKME